MRAALQTADNIKNHATAEYHRHACGRAIAAIQNFKIIANNPQRFPHRPRGAISDANMLIQNALKDTYGRFYTIEGSFCIDRKTLRPIVTTYRRGSDNHLTSTNFSYRFL
jgi:hypothetical protein